MKAQEKKDIQDVFGEKLSTSILIRLIALFPELLKTILEIIKVFKDHKRLNKIMAEDKPDPGTTPPAP